jgi:hypothetical protein
LLAPNCDIKYRHVIMPSTGINERLFTKESAVTTVATRMKRIIGIRGLSTLRSAMLKNSSQLFLK